MASGSSGISSTSTRPSRMASADRSARTSRSPVGGGVALGEDQVDRGEHHAEPVGQLRGRRDPVRGVVVAQLALRPNDPLGDGRLRHEERAGDLGGVEATQQSQGERHLGVGRQRGMAAQEHQAQLVVGDHVGELVELGPASPGVDGSLRFVGSSFMPVPPSR